MGVVHLTKAALLVRFNTSELLGARASRTCAPLMPTVPGRAAPQTPVIPYKQLEIDLPYSKRENGKGGRLYAYYVVGEGWGGLPAVTYTLQPCG